MDIYILTFQIRLCHDFVSAFMRWEAKTVQSWFQMWELENVSDD